MGIASPAITLLAGLALLGSQLHSEPAARSGHAPGLTARQAAGKPAPRKPAKPSAWRWDARTATVDADSAAEIAAFQQYAVGAGTYFQAAVAWVNAPAQTPRYTVPVVGQPIDRIVAPIPPGTKPGASFDHSLTVRAADGTDYDFGQAVFDAGSGRIVSTGGAAPVPPGAVYEAGRGSANAAAFPLRAGLVTPKDIAANGIAHPLHLSMPNVGPPPNVFPARGHYGFPGNTGLPLGTWVRLDPTVDIPSLHLPKFDRLICFALQRYGAFVRDIGSTLSVMGADQVNQGGNAKDWPAVGVGLPYRTPDGVPYARSLSSRIPWARLQVLRPPNTR